MLKVTTGNVDDRQPVAEMCEDLWGLLYGESFGGLNCLYLSRKEAEH